jgi:hypothetical protein
MKHPRPALVLSVLCVLSAVLLLPLAACSGGGAATGTAPSDGFPAPSKDFVFNVAAEVLRKQGLAPSMEDSSRQTWTVATHWKNTPSPFSRTGYRQKATVKVMDVPNRAGYYFTETQLVRQQNNNIKDPSNMLVADWGDEQRDGDGERAINRQIEMQFLSGEVSTQFRERYGMPTQDPYRIDRSAIPCPDATPAPETRYP